MADEPQDPFAAELARRDAQDPFAAELRARERENMSGADVAKDVALQTATGLNKGIAEFVSAPYRVLDWAGEKVTGGDFLPNVEDMSMWKPYMKPPEAASKAGEYVRSAGEVTGGSLIPIVAMLNRARQVGQAALTSQPAQTAWQGIKDTFTRPYATAPGAAVTTDVVAGTAAGFGQKAAEDAGFGPAGQTIAGLGAAALPFAAKSLYDVPAGYIREARANATPHAKVAQHITQDGTTLDDFALQTGVGSTAGAPRQIDRQNLMRVIDTLGEEMIANRGDEAAAIAATITRAAQDTGLAPSTIADWVRRMTAAQYDNPLMLGEYPSVMASNTATRQRSTRNILDEMARAEEQRSPQEAADIRRAADPGRIEDNSTHWLLDTIANSGGGEGSTTIRRAIEDRLDGLNGMVRHRVQDWAPGTTQDAETALETMRRLASADYRNIYNNPNGTPVNYSMLHGMLPRVVDRAINRMGGYNAEQADALRQAVNQIYATRPAGVAARQALPGTEDQLAQLRMQIREARRQRAPRDQIDNMSRQADQLGEQLRLERRDATPPTQQHLLLTLEQLQNSRSAIRGMLDGYRADPSKRHLLPVVEPLYRDLTRLMQRASPEWARANRSWADMELGRVARELGQNLSDKASPAFRQQIAEFRALNPIAQDFVRMEFAQQFDDAVRNEGRGDNLAKFFKTPHIRDVVREVFGDEAAVDMMRMTRDLNVAAKSKNMMHGSPTAPRQERAKRLNSDIEMLAETEIPSSVGALLDKVKKYAVQKFVAKRDADMANILTTPMRDVPQIAEHIERMRQAQNLAARYAPNVRLMDALRNGRGNAIRMTPGMATNATDGQD